jgi:hypothetical protein
MFILLTLVLSLTVVCFILLTMNRKSEESEKNIRGLNLRIILPLSASVILWLIWCAIREYRRPVYMNEHWLSTLIAFGSMILAIVASIQAFRNLTMMRLSIGFLCLFISLVYLLGVLISIPVS